MFSDFLRARRGARSFSALPEDARAIVFYAEDAASWAHLGPVVESLLVDFKQPVCYLTSDGGDPILDRTHSGLNAYYIGSGVVRTALFTGLKASVCAMTMPDLHQLQIKRSVAHPVHYVYLFHSLVSTHMIYRSGAFDHYDTVLCSGPHHVREIRATEQFYGLTSKHLVEHGYGRLDTLLDAATTPRVRRAGDPIRVLLGPSWGPNGVLETNGVETVRVLLDAGFHVTVRPHPMTRRHNSALLDDLTRTFQSRAEFDFEENVASQDSLHNSDILISDWSGIALEYAFFAGRPVVFMDVPRKVNNPDYERLGLEPLEVSIRERLGSIAIPDRLDELPALVETLCANPAATASALEQIRSECVFNVGNSGRAGAVAILELSESALADADNTSQSAD